MKQFKTYTYTTPKELKKFDLPIKLTTHFELFFNASDLPEELVEYSTQIITKQNKFSSFDELNDRILGIIEDFEAQFVEETRKKVILYSISYHQQYSNYEQTIYFHYKVAQRVDAGKQTRYYEERSARGRSLGTTLDEINVNDISRGQRSDPSEMLWTAERELWFEEMNKSIHRLGRQLLEGFGDKPEVLARKIEQGGLKLLLAGKEE